MRVAMFPRHDMVLMTICTQVSYRARGITSTHGPCKGASSDSRRRAHDGSDSSGLLDHPNHVCDGRNRGEDGLDVEEDLNLDVSQGKTHGRMTYSVKGKPHGRQ